MFEHHDAGEDARAAAEVVLRAEGVQPARMQPSVLAARTAIADEENFDLIDDHDDTVMVIREAPAAPLPSPDASPRQVSARHIGTTEITQQIQQAIADSGVHEGLCTVFIHHTSASLIINENADPDVQRDLDVFLSRLVPDGDDAFVHTVEGPDDMPAHVRTALTQTSLSIPVSDGRCGLGTWQGVFLWEHRHRGHQRRVTVSVVS